MRDAEYRCEWAGTIPNCRDLATGYAGGPDEQHPLCGEHVKPHHHPPDDLARLHPDEPITAPCMHAQPYLR